MCEISCAPKSDSAVRPPRVPRRAAHTRGAVRRRTAFRRWPPRAEHDTGGRGRRAARAMAIFGGAAARARASRRPRRLWRGRSATRRRRRRPPRGRSSGRGLAEMARRVGSGAREGCSTRASATPSTDGARAGAGRARRAAQRATRSGEGRGEPFAGRPSEREGCARWTRNAYPRRPARWSWTRGAWRWDATARPRTREATRLPRRRRLMRRRRRNPPRMRARDGVSKEKRRRTNATRRGDVSSNAPGRGGVCPRSFACVASRRRGFGKRHRCRWVVPRCFPPTPARVRPRLGHRDPPTRRCCCAARTRTRICKMTRARGFCPRTLSPRTGPARGALGRRRRRRGRRRRRHVRTRRGNDRERRLRRFTRRCTKRCTRRATKTTSRSLLRGALIRAAAVAAAGGAVVWTGGDGFDGNVLADVRRFLRRSAGGSDETGPRVYGAGRFDPATAPAEEWARFGGHYFFLPTVEVAEGARSATVARPSPGTGEPRGLRRDFRRRRRRRHAATAGTRSAPRASRRRRRRRRMPSTPRSEPRRNARKRVEPKRVAEEASRRPDRRRPWARPSSPTAPGGRRWWGRC